jgi:hypothetical protein
VAGAADHDRQRRLVEAGRETPARGDQLRDGAEVATAHHAEIEAAREASLAPEPHHRLRFLLGAVDRTVQRVDQREREGVGLAVVDAQHRDVALEFVRDRIAHRSRSPISRLRRARRSPGRRRCTS